MIGWIQRMPPAPVLSREDMEVPAAGQSSMGNAAHAVMYLHGFTGAPQEHRRFIDSLAASGLDVYAPCLPGHGTTPHDLIFLHRRQWMRFVVERFEAMQRRYPVASLAGISMGGVLALHAAVHAAKPPDRLVMLAAPAWIGDPSGRKWLPRLHWTPIKYFLGKTKDDGSDIADPTERYQPSNYNWMPISALTELDRLVTEVREEAAGVRCPTLLIHARQDHTAEYESMQWYAERLGGPVETVTLERSYHVITRDVEVGEVVRAMTDFLHS